MEHAVAAERRRAKEMEAKEADLSADELRQILKEERHRMAGFARTIADLRSTAVECQSQAEIHEEGRINSLLGRLETMQVEKGRIVNELEREEEMLTNTLQKKLDQVKREKAQLEKLMEQEHLSHSNSPSTMTGLREESTASGTNEEVGNKVDDKPAVASLTYALGQPPSTLGALSEGESVDDDEDEEVGDLDAALADLAALDKEP